MSRILAPRALVIVWLVGLTWPTPVIAHDFTFTETTLTLGADGTFQVDLICDLDALALGVSPTVDNAELARVLREMPPDEFARQVGRLRDLFQRRVRVRFDDEPAPFEVSFPEHGTPAADEAEAPSVLGVIARMTGVIPAGAASVSFFASRAFPIVHLTIHDERRSLTVREVLEYGDPSQPFPLVLTAAPRARSRAAAALQYLRLGFRHIVPDGLDHTLFVLGLFLFSARLGPLLWQVTAFTVAHAVTLALAVYGVVALSPRIVEPLIALSIAYVAFENLVTERLTPWRPAVVFAFGLLHGLGFAGVLRELGLPPQERLAALVAFNAGIELGQLAVIALALAAVGWCRERRWYRPRVAMPLSFLIGSAGLVWAIQRAFLM